MNPKKVQLRGKTYIYWCSECGQPIVQQVVEEEVYCVRCARKMTRLLSKV